MPVTINPSLKTKIGLIKQGEYTLDCIPDVHNFKASISESNGKVKLTIEVELKDSVVIKSAQTKTDAEWVLEKDKTCYWDFVAGTQNIEVVAKPLIKFIPTVNPNDTILDVAFGFSISKGKIGGGAGKIGGGAGGLGGPHAESFWI